MINVCKMFIDDLINVWYESKSTFLTDYYSLRKPTLSLDCMLSLLIMAATDFNLSYCPLYFYPYYSKIRIEESSTIKTLGELKYNATVNRNIEINIYKDGNTPYTLLHELAHLKHRNHGWKFHKFYIKLMKWYVKKNKKVVNTNEHTTNG